MPGLWRAKILFMPPAETGLAANAGTTARLCAPRRTRRLRPPPERYSSFFVPRITRTMRSRRTMSPMTIVVVRDEPAGSSEDGASVFVAGFAASAVAGAGADVVGAPADAAVVAVEAVVAVVAVFAMASADGAAVCGEKGQEESGDRGASLHGR